MRLNDHQFSEHSARRKAFAERIGSNAIAIVPAASEVTRANDTHYRFRQNSDFAYLTGFPEPEAIAVIAPGRSIASKNENGEDVQVPAEYVLFVRPRSKHHEIWDGRRFGPEGAAAFFGAQQAFNLTEFEAELPKLIAGREVLHYTLAEFPELDVKVTAAIKHIRAISRRGGAAPHSISALETSLHEQRLIKRGVELELMRKACAVSAAAHLKAMQMTRPGLNEWQVTAAIHAEFGAADCEPGYGTICGGGDNACILHYTENNMPLKAGELLLIDAGAEYRGYTGDITRTFPINGRFNKAQAAMYQVVLDAQKAAIAELRVGNGSDKPHEVSTRVLTEGMVKLGLLKGDVDALIKAEKHKQFFMHGTGHWLGMDVHDVGRYKLNGTPRAFEAGMIMTVEPGLYVAPDTEGVPLEYLGLGIRIEDDVLVTDEGPEVLTAGVPKEIAEIEAVMAAAQAASE